MSKADDALRGLAQNRGCKLVKSRVRTPGRKDHGKYGLRDGETGKEVFGFSRHRLTAAPEEIEEFLRSRASEGWRASIRRHGMGKSR